MRTLKEIHSVMMQGVKDAKKDGEGYSYEATERIAEHLRTLITDEERDLMRGRQTKLREDVEVIMVQYRLCRISKKIKKAQVKVLEDAYNVEIGQ
jgi:hypothetical protein